MTSPHRDLHTPTDLARRLQEGDTELALMLMDRCGARLDTTFAHSDGIKSGSVSLLGLALSAPTSDLMDAVLSQHQDAAHVSEPRFARLLEEAGVEALQSWGREAPQQHPRTALEYAFRTPRTAPLQWVLEREKEGAAPSPSRILNLMGCGSDRVFMAHVLWLQQRFRWTPAEWVGVEWGDAHRRRGFAFSMLAHAPVPVALSLDPALNPKEVVAWWVHEAGGSPELKVGWEGCPQESWLAVAARLRCWPLVAALMEVGAVPHPNLAAELDVAHDTARQEVLRFNGLTGLPGRVRDDLNEARHEAEERMALVGKLRLNMGVSECPPPPSRPRF